MKPVVLAPLEGIGNHIYRSAFTRHYPGVDSFVTPFIDINSDGAMKGRCLADILPENNEGITLLPQVLTKSPAALAKAAKKIADLGYGEISLNLGCPSPTVTKKGKGSELLRDPKVLDAFLSGCFSSCPLKLSVKTRIGISDLSEWEGLMEVFNRYPLASLTVHPRLQTEFYKGSIHEDVFRKMYEKAEMPLILNPGIRDREGFEYYEKAYPRVTSLMIGRGLVEDPALGAKIRGITVKEDTFREFHDDLLESYREVLSGETPVLFKMKELWDYWDRSVPVDPKLRKALRKAGSLREYTSAVRLILN